MNERTNVGPSWHIKVLVEDNNEPKGISSHSP